MPSRRARCVLILSLFDFVVAAPAFAHHEAMFGPQSSAVLSPGIFISAQLFDKEYGQDETVYRETTAVLSAGVKPFKKNPLSVALVVPFTFATTAGEPTTKRFEDALITARYRVSADGVKNSLGLDESYVMGVGGLEVPTGNMDHEFLKGPFGGMVAGLFSVEKRPVAAIFYAYYHHAGIYNGNRAAGNMFTGTGVAYTPIDNDERGKLFSLQLGLSYERTFQIEENYVTVPESGSSGVFLHPGIVWSTTPRYQFFALVSLPVTQQYNSLTERQRFRLGGGTIIILGH